MPEYLAPGVYVEETSFRSKSIEGVSTTTTGFVGPTRYGPTDLEPEVLTSLVEFERVYGDGRPLEFLDETGQPLRPPVTNFMWHAARAFFAEGGKRLYVSRVFEPIRDQAGNVVAGGDGRASATLSAEVDTALGAVVGAALPGLAAASPDTTRTFRVAARFPGAVGRMRVKLALQLGLNVLAATPAGPQVRGLSEFDTVHVTRRVIDSPLGQVREVSGFYAAELDPDAPAPVWRFAGTGGSSDVLTLADLHATADPKATDTVRVVTLKVTVTPPSDPEAEQVFDGLAVDPRHKRGGTPDSVFHYFEPRPTNPARARSLPIVVTLTEQRTEGGTTRTVPARFERGTDFLTYLFGYYPALRYRLPAGADASVTLVLDGGHDGRPPTASGYEGAEDPDTGAKTGLKAFEDLEDISIVAAPGATYRLADRRADAVGVMQHLINHCHRMKYRIAVLDSGDEQSIGDVRNLRYQFDSSHAALYYPWVRVLDPVTNREIHLPPSGFVAGIYARNDVQRGVYKAPANEVVTLALGFEKTLNTGQQEVLNPDGVNCFRFFEGRGYRLWGARTVSSDQEWKYVNLRRYFAYLERSIDRGTQFAVFEPNGPALWENVRRTIEDFLFNEWQQGALLGEKPDKAFFVRCDRSTMTQNDLDNGRMICLIGVAPLRPAEFVIFRIGQFTADRRS